MSESGDGGPGRREVAHRLFAAEFDDADFSYSESDEERAPNYVVTPTGARVNRLFLAGVLTELEQVNDDVLRARVVDPTGPFVIYAGQYQPDELAFLETAEPPMFVAVTGKARTFQPDDSDRVFTSVRPESISEVDADTRDRWVVQAAEQTVSRIGQIASAKQAGLTGDDLRLALLDQGIDESAAAGITLALDHYGTTGDYLDALRTMALDAARVVAGDTDEAEGLSLSPGDGTDDPLPLLASLDIEADVATPGTTTDESGAEPLADESAADTSVDETATTTDEPVAETTTADATAGDTADDLTAGEPATEPAAGESTTATTTDDEPTVAETEPESVDPSTGASESTATATGSESPSGTEAESTVETTETDSTPDTTDSETTAAASVGSDADSDDDLGEFEPEFELDEDERKEIEQEYGTDFQSGSEVDEPGEAGIETPDPEELDAEEEPEATTETDATGGVEAEADVGGDPDADATAAAESEPSGSETTDTDPSADQAASDTASETAAEPESESDDADDGGAEPATDISLEDAVMEVMEELDDGSGADREELLATVVDRHGADADAVEDAVQDALMGGRCYEPDDGKLTSI